MRALCLLLTGTMLAAGSGRCPDRPSLVIFALFGMSGSTSEQAGRERYRADFETIIHRFYDPASKDRTSRADYSGEVFVEADAITGNTLGTATLPVRGCFPAYSAFTSNPLRHKSELRAAEAELRAQLEKLMARKDATKYTSILDGMQLAAKAFNGEQIPHSSARYLIVFSDMIEESQRYNFTRERLTDARVAQIIDSERNAGRLPDLHGVKVWVAGAGATGVNGAPNDRAQAIQRFWVAYFGACGADLTRERYSAVLMNFDLPAH